MDEQLAVLIELVRKNDEKLTILKVQFDDFRDRIVYQRADNDRAVETAARILAISHAELLAQVKVLEQKRTTQEGGDIVRQQKKDTYMIWAGWLVAIAIAAFEYFKK